MSSFIVEIDEQTEQKIKAYGNIWPDVPFHLETMRDVVDRQPGAAHHIVRLLVDNMELHK